MADVVVTGGNGDSGVGAGIVLGILIAIIAIGFAVWWFGFNNAGNSGSTNINVNPPQINVNVPSPASS